MVAAVGCSDEAFLYTSPSGARRRLRRPASSWGWQTLLAAMQILDQTLYRMRYSTQGRILAELALVRICELEDLDDLSEMIAQLRLGVPVEVNAAAPSAVKKKYDTAVGSVSGSVGVPPADRRAGSLSAASSTGVPPASHGQDARATGDAGWGGSCTATPGAAVQLPPQPIEPAVELTAQNAVEVWSHALAGLSGMVVDQARHFDSIAFLAPNRLVIRFKPVYDFSKGFCERPEQLARFEKSLSELTGQPIRVEFALTADEPGEPVAAVPVASPHQRRIEAMQNPLVRRAAELFGAQVVDVVDPPRRE